jgi:hypothetical protein
MAVVEAPPPTVSSVGVEDVLRGGGFTRFHRRAVAVTGFAWTFVAMEILLVGFTIAAPLYVFLYLRLQGRESWKLTLSLTASTFVFFYGLFVWILNTHFEEGWIFAGLRAMGIMT